MEYMYKFLLLLIISISSHAGGHEYTCTAKWINYHGDDKLYTAPDILKKVYITFVDDKLDYMKFRTINQSSYYEFNHIIHPPHGGMVYKSDNGNKLVVYEKRKI